MLVPCLPNKWNHEKFKSHVMNPALYKKKKWFDLLLKPWLVGHKCEVGAVNQLVCGSLPWLRSRAGAWELGNVWVHIKPFHYVLDPGKALCDLASGCIYPSRDWTQTHTNACQNTRTHTSPPFFSFPYGLVRRRGGSQGQPQTKLTLISGWRSPAALPCKIKVRRIQGEILKCQMETWQRGGTK